MIANRIHGTTRVLAKDQPQYLQLCIRDELFEDGCNYMVSSWSPTPDELARLNAGASIELRILGSIHPPVVMTVGELSFTETKSDD